MFNFPIYKRYSFWRVFFVVFIISFSAFLWAYISKLIVNEPFNWVGYREYLPNQSIGTIAMSLFYFYALNKFNYLWQSKRKFRTFIPTIFLSILFIVGYNYLADRLMPLSNNIQDPLPLKNLLFGYFVFAVISVGISFLIIYVNNLRDDRKKHKLLEEQKLKLEVEKSQAELMFLKSQINPHFLHNTLNSFYARSLPFSKELSDGILTLSEIMRYALEDAHATGGKVFIKSEIEHVRNLIKLYQFRFRNNLQIQMSVRGVLNGYTIIPFVLITLVENIFKHGDLTDNRYPIEIDVEVHAGRFRYFSQNRKTNGPKELSTGIGLDNIKKRLDLAYGTDYTLAVHDDEDTYTTELIIEKL